MKKANYCLKYSILNNVKGCKCIKNLSAKVGLVRVDFSCWGFCLGTTFFTYTLHKKAILKSRKRERQGHFKR